MLQTFQTFQGKIQAVRPDHIFPFREIQRGIDLKHVSEIIRRGFNWNEFGYPTIQTWDPWIKPYLSKGQWGKLGFDPTQAFHPSDGHHRFAVVNRLWPTGKYEGPYVHLRPQGTDEGDRVWIFCNILESCPVKSFLGLNADLAVSGAERFRVKVNAERLLPGSYPEALALYKAVSARGLLVSCIDRSAGAKNTITVAHQLDKPWARNEQTVCDMLDVVTDVYSTQGVVDPKALTFAFTMALIEVLRESPYDKSSVVKALRACVCKWPAYGIVQKCAANGSRGAKPKTKRVLERLVSFYMTNRRVPRDNEVSCEEGL